MPKDLGFFFFLFKESVYSSSLRTTFYIYTIPKYGLKYECFVHVFFSFGLML